MGIQGVRLEQAVLSQTSYSLGCDGALSRLWENVQRPIPEAPPEEGAHCCRLRDLWSCREECETPHAGSPHGRLRQEVPLQRLWQRIHVQSDDGQPQDEHAHKGSAVPIPLWL